MLISNKSIDTSGKKSNPPTMSEEEYDEWNQGEAEEEGMDSMIIGGVTFGILLSVGVVLYYNEMICFKGVSEKQKVKFIDEDGDEQIFTYHEESKTWDHQQLVAPKNQGRIEDGKDFTNCFHKGLTLRFEPSIGYIEWHYEEERKFQSVVVPEDQRTDVMKKMKSFQPQYYPALIPTQDTDKFISKILEFDANMNQWEYVFQTSKGKKLMKTKHLPTIYGFFHGYDEYSNGQKVYDFMVNVMKACDEKKFQDFLKEKTSEELTDLQNEFDQLAKQYPNLTEKKIKEIIQTAIDNKGESKMEE